MINGQVRAIFVKCAKTLGVEVEVVGNPSFYCLDDKQVTFTIHLRKTNPYGSVYYI